MISMPHKWQLQPNKNQWTFIIHRKEREDKKICNLCTVERITYMPSLFNLVTIGFMERWKEKYFNEQAILPTIPLSKCPLYKAPDAEVNCWVQR